MPPFTNAYDIVPFLQLMSFFSHNSLHKKTTYLRDKWICAYQNKRIDDHKRHAFAFLASRTKLKGRD